MNETSQETPAPVGEGMTREAVRKLLHELSCESVLTEEVERLGATIERLYAECDRLRAELSDTEEENAALTDELVALRAQRGEAVAGGDGWRLLNVGEEIREGDEKWCDAAPANHHWLPLASVDRDEAVHEHDNPIRRRFTIPAAGGAQPSEDAVERAAKATLVKENSGAVRSSSKFLLERYAGARCDSPAVSGCIRCNTVYLARTSVRLLDAAALSAAGAQQGAE